MSMRKQESDTPLFPAGDLQRQVLNATLRLLGNLGFGFEESERRDLTRTLDPILYPCLPEKLRSLGFLAIYNN